jgi:serine/threonine protein kinase
MEASIESEQTLFEACAALAPPDRHAYLEHACAGRLAVRDRLQRLLAAHEHAERATLRPLEALTLETVPDVVGPYQLVGVLGEGGMGVVYEAEQRVPVQRRVALKIVKLGMDTRQVVARFTAERQALAAMDHPYVAKVFDAGQTVSGRPYFVMEIIRGVPLLEYCDRNDLSVRQRIELFILICQAVQHAHQKGVVHRDLKPSNLLVSPGDTGPVPKVIDFGIAKAVSGDSPQAGSVVTRGGQALGTPAYMSPEQAGRGGIDIDTRTDIYSLGVVLYELLTGTLPADPTTTGEARFLAMLAGGEIDPPRPSRRVGLNRRIEGDLDWIVMKALAIDRADRYATALSLAEDLGRYLTDEPVSARQPTLSYRAGKFLRRHRVQVAAAALAAVALVGGVVAASAGLVRANRAEAQARREAATAREVSGFLTGLFAAPDPNLRSATTLRDLLDRGASRIESELENQPDVQASLLETLSHVYGSLGLHREAIAQAERSLALDAAAGRETLQTAAASLTLGRSAMSLGDFPRARRAFDRTLAIRTRLLGEDHLEVATVLNNLGGLYSQLEQVEESIAAHTRALAIQERVAGADDIRVTNSLRGLGILYSRKKEFARGLALQLRVLRIYEATYGSDHPLTAGGFENVAWDLKDLHRLADARSYAERALAIRLNTIGPDHPQIAFTHSLLGQLFAAEGKLDRARSAYEEALRVREVALGPENPRTADTLSDLGRLALQRGDAGEASGLLQRALGIYEKGYGPGHSKTIESRAQLALALERTKAGTEHGISPGTR